MLQSKQWALYGSGSPRWNTFGRQVAPLQLKNSLRMFLKHCTCHAASLAEDGLSDEVGCGVIPYRQTVQAWHRMLDGKSAKPRAVRAGRPEEKLVYGIGASLRDKFDHTFT